VIGKVITVLEMQDSALRELIVRTIPECLNDANDRAFLQIPDIRY
jgi:hypothetical protein